MVEADAALQIGHGKGQVVEAAEHDFFLLWAAFGHHTLHLFDQPLQPAIAATSGFIALAIAGQMFAPLLLDHFGLFGLVERQLMTTRVLGTLLLIGGVALIQFSAIPARALATAS